MPEPVTPPADPAPTGTPPADPAPSGGADPGTPPAPSAPVNLDGPYDEARGTRLIANLRAELAAEKAKRQTGEPADVAAMKAQLDAITAELAKTRTDAIEAAKKAAIAEAKVPAHLASYVTGATAEEIAASAAKVAADFAAGLPTASADPLPGKPKPQLTPGTAPNDAPTAFDPVATAKAARGF
ncbi:hypothetical protein CA850_29805 [Micromonospora echinospora]|uniref:Scaffolding protein n=1 Tax=Micromonospora echinospora TaxID=1877 RepID=A0A1C5AAR5_MICEC|nr:hypothetical protein [Micromonospora echinospora]OZV74775.1 hypothetical protein CA850_29805 [Micromonospora echinospora]SCF42300.1 Domain of unknown function [Micromonospora echinospora]